MIFFCVFFFSVLFDFVFFFFQAEDGIRDRSPSRGLGDVYKRSVPRVCYREKEGAKSQCQFSQMQPRLSITILRASLRYFLNREIRILITGIAGIRHLCITKTTNRLEKRTLLAVHQI